MVELGRTDLKGSELINMEVGDVIVLDNEVTQPFCLVEGIPKFGANAGICRGNRAFQVKRNNTLTTNRHRVSLVEER